MIRKMFDSITAKARADRREELYRAFKRREAKIGGELFGPIPKGVRRDFFCLDRHTWVWHEEWTDQTGQRQSRTIRYNVRPNGVLKAQDNQAYQPVSPQETENLYQATQQYKQRVLQEVYSFA
jgi:hypothetical protein